MSSFGKKILSAFVEVGDEKKKPAHDAETSSPDSAAGTVQFAPGGSVANGGSSATGGRSDQRFLDYFDKLFSEANIPGPDYYEFARMTSAMQAIPDERSRFAAAFAGLQVQGLDKEKLLSTAGEYLRVLTADADRFDKTVEASLQEKVHSRSAEADEKGRRIQDLSQEVLELQAQITAMQREVREAKDKLDANSNAYAAESERRKQQIQNDIGKINNYIH
jgi:archaellum component FlaC